MDNIKIRTATLDDIDILLEFEQGVIKAERPFDVTLGADPITYYNLEELIVSDDASLVVAEIEGEIISSGYALIIRSPIRSGLTKRSIRDRGP